MRSIPPYTMRSLNKNPTRVRLRTKANNIRINKLSNLNRNMALEQIIVLREDIKEILRFANDFDITGYLQDLQKKLSYWEGLVGGKP